MFLNDTTNSHLLSPKLSERYRFEFYKSLSITIDLYSDLKSNEHLYELLKNLITIYRYKQDDMETDEDKIRFYLSYVIEKTLKDIEESNYKNIIESISNNILSEFMTQLNVLERVSFKSISYIPTVDVWMKTMKNLGVL